MHIHITFMTYHIYMLIACKSFPLPVLCLWHSFYLYFSCISVSIFYIFHIHSITYCSMSLTYLLSILSYHLRLYCTFIYILILFIYGTLVCFNLVLFIYCTFICLFTCSSFLPRFGKYIGLPSEANCWIMLRNSHGPHLK